MDFEKEQDLTCPECGKKHKVIMYERIIGQKQPELKKKLLRNELFRFTCDECGVSMPMIYPCLYQDTERGYMVWFAPSSNGEIQEKLAAFNVDALKDDTYTKMNKQYKLRIVKSINAFIEKILIFDEGMDDRAIEVQKVMLVAQLQQSPEYREDGVRGVFFELLQGRTYGYTVLFDKAEPLALKLDMEQYYKIYTRHKDTFSENTPEGFALIQNQWGVEQFQAIMKASMRSKGKRRKKF